MRKRKEGFKILLVDDDHFIVKLFEKYFKPPKYFLIVASNGIKGLEKARNSKPDIIISDVMTGTEMDGYTLCKEIRKDPIFTRTIFLLSSAAKTEIKDAIKGLKGGASDYLLKPFDMRQTVAKIDAFLRIKKLQDDLLVTNQELNNTITELEDHKKMLEESNRILEEDKKRLKNSLKEISYLVEELEKSHDHHISLRRSIEKNFDEIVNLLATIIEQRNPYHRGYSQKVAEITNFIANKLGLSKEEIRDIEVASLLHEIGMIGIPDKIMKKHYTEYTEEEQMTVAQHPLVGESLLKGYSGLEKVATIIRHLHENVDGSGYPDGLTVDEFPIGSQIIRVAYMFERMTSRATEVGDYYRAVIALKEKADIEFNSQIIRFLKDYVDTFADRRKVQRTKKVDILNLKEGLVLSEDLYTSTGIKLIPKNTKLTDASIKCILNYNKTDPLDKGISIYIR